MAIKQTAHIIKGLRQDFSDSKQPKEYAIDAKNIRITNREDSSLLSITNEKGTKEVALNPSILGRQLGHTVINNILVLFTRYEEQESITDYIYKIKPDEITNTILFQGSLSTKNIDHIEALGVYESEDIQKVYWVDGVNQPRMINIVDETLRTNSKEFDFIQELKLQEIINVEKSYSSGSFSSGVIQYAFNYYNKNGQETNIVDVTPINYISYEDRGASPNEYVSNSFKITIKNYDSNFDYLRLYSIHRTALDAPPSVKKVVDINLKTTGNLVTVDYIDTGIIGETIDPAELLFKGGEYIIPKTLAQKDGTLFFGNIKLKHLSEDSELKDILTSWRNSTTITYGDASVDTFSWNMGEIISESNLTGYYPFKANLVSNTAGFKAREFYRLGIQFQDKTGKWSDPIWYKDSKVNISPETFIFNSKIEYHKTSALLYLTQELKEWAFNKGYIKVRPVVVFPNDEEKEVVAQGILCPTVFNAKDRQNGICFSQSSWFLRPNHNAEIKSSTAESENDKFSDYNIPEWGSWAEFRHYRPLPSCSKRNAEIQTNIVGTIQNDLGYSVALNNKDALYTISNTSTDSIEDLLRDSSTYFSDSYFIDQSILTFHSPEIELQHVTNIENAKVKIVGVVPFNSNIGDIKITTKNNALDFNITNFINYHTGVIDYENFPNVISSASRSLISGFFYVDEEIRNSDSKHYRGFMVYPWNRKASLNTSLSDTDKELYSVINNKKISNIKYSLQTIYLDDNVEKELYGSCYLFSGENNLRIKAPKNINTSTNTYDYIYKGNIDSIVTPYYGDLKLFSEDIVVIYDYGQDPFIPLKEGTPSIFSKEKYTSSINISYKDIFNSEVTYDSASSEYHTYKDVINITYKSAPHGVFVLDYDNDGTQNILDSKNNNTFNKDKDVDKYSITYGGILINKIKSIDISENITDGKSFLWLAELYREVPNKFGGNDYKNNIWYPAGESINIARWESSSKTHTLISGLRGVQFTQGDTFFSRFDSLKTYSDDLDAVNSVTEIGSFMVETRINLDARYDRNRGKQSNLVMNPGNFNLFNDVYNQKNNFFNYRIIDKDIADNTEFPNTIVWSKQKFAGADIDAWTSINMASSLDLDGTKGELTKLVSFKNEIFSFQPEAINHILFNSRVQIPTSDGLPIEITNSYKVEGARQLSSIGSSNPLAITPTDRGIYYMDNITKGIYIFNGQTSDPLSDRLGMSSWVRKQDINSYRVDYDKINQDVYFNGDECLCYSEKLGEFESFFDYTDSIIFNVKDGTYAVNSNTLYKLFEGDYNNFFDEDEKKPFWVTITHNENPFNDKIYNTLEFRADTYDYITKDENNQDVTPYWKLSNNSSLNTIKVDNEYQNTNEVSLEFNRYTPSNLKRKFRIWRANIPRDSVNKRDRIRNTWANITLKASNPSNTKTELHDLVVSYFM